MTVRTTGHDDPTTDPDEDAEARALIHAAKVSRELQRGLLAYLVEGGRGRTRQQRLAMVTWRLERLAADGRGGGG